MGKGTKTQMVQHFGTNREKSRRMTSHANARAPVGPPDWAPAYLSALEVCLGQKIKAAEAANVTPRTVQRRRNIDAGFAAEEQDRMEVVKDAVESEITRRAIEGVTRKRYDRNGKLISQDIEYSDVLLLRLAERTETGSWRQKQQIESSLRFAYATRAERKAALEKARAELTQPVTCAAPNGLYDCERERSVRTPDGPTVAHLRASGRVEIGDSIAKQSFSEKTRQSEKFHAPSETRDGHLGKRLGPVERKSWKKFGT